MMEIFIARSDERYLFPLPLFSARIGRPAKSVMKAAIIRISSLMVNLCFYPLATISSRFFRGERKYKTQGMGNGLRTDNPRKGKRNCRKRTQTFFFPFGLFSIFLPYRRTQEEGIKTLQFSSKTIFRLTKSSRIEAEKNQFNITESLSKIGFPMSKIC